jgi:molybdopterin-guanine dinucleotide biosynthesis protein A
MMQHEDPASDSRMTLSAVLLTGGESHRMGVEKATIIFQGAPVWQRQISLLRELQPQEIFISARSERPWRPADTELVLDKTPACGPLSGLVRALERMQTSHVVVLAVDMPFMKSAHLEFLCSLAREGRGVLPMIGERAEPLAAVYPREALSDFSAALRSNQFSLQPLCRNLTRAGKLRVFQISDEEKEFYRNVNEPTDLTIGGFGPARNSLPEFR